MGLFGALVCVGIGLYGGTYICQNYDIPNVKNPRDFIDQMKAHMKQYEKKDTDNVDKNNEKK